MSENPLDEIRRVERGVAAAIDAARAESEAAEQEARRRTEQLVRDARTRGRALAERRYQEGLARARDDAQRILADADERVAALRRQAEPHLPAAVDLVMEMVLPQGGSGA